MNALIPHQPLLELDPTHPAPAPLTFMRSAAFSEASRQVAAETDALMASFNPARRLEQIRRAHASAEPTDANPAWKHAQRDVGFLLDQIERLDFARATFQHGHRVASENCVRLEGELDRARQMAARLRAALQEVRETLQFANDSPNGGIHDTIWMMHRPETLFDFIDAAMQKGSGQ